MLVKLTTFLVLATACLAFPAEELKAPVPEGPVYKEPAPVAVSPEDASDLQADNSFWYGGGGGYHHHHHYPVYRSYYRPRTYSYYSYYEPYHYSSWW